MSKPKETPLMKQYNSVKSKYPNTILLFRLGDFYETFNEDAEIAAKVLGITLTKRNNGAAGKMPLAGFPHHQLDVYLPKLVKGGHRVAVCEQMEDPKMAKGIVKRDVVEVVTPGVALYDKLLDSKKNNYIASLFYYELKNSGFYSLAYTDVSTGEFKIAEFREENVIDIIESINPMELIISKEQKNYLEPIINQLSYDISLTRLEDWIFEESFGNELLLSHFKTKSLKGFGIENMTYMIIAAGAILHYISETQKSALPHLSNISIYNPSDYMPLDFATRKNLEIVSNSEGGRNDSLIDVLDRTKTSMGARMLRNWITRPLKNINEINKRLESTNALFQNIGQRQFIRKALSEISDLERLISKICTGRANPRDLMYLKNSLEKLPPIKEAVNELNEHSLINIVDKINNLEQLVQLIENSLNDEPPANVGLGNVFKTGFNQELDTYIEAKYSGKNWLTNYQEDERKKSNIPSLKIGFNNVYGYYIEITKVHADKVPDYYTRRQTLTNAERYISPELKELEEKILSAEEKIKDLELKLFENLRQEVIKFTKDIQKNALLISQIDCLQSYAQISQENNYTKPQIDESTQLNIKNGRHPVVEKILAHGEVFTKNDTQLDTASNQIQIITGPNMSGKSCYLRQNALIVLMSQIGCFVPAETAQIGLVDRIFTRVGAQDNITSGESTFLVEMQETANILNNATNRSLILLDEVGRGTATFDGISIAWSIAEFLHNKLKAKTLFATHYHELNELENRYERINNYSVEVVETGSKVVFTHKVKKGGSDHSFGIYVAKMAGLPNKVIQRADEIMRSFEADTQQGRIDSELEIKKPHTSSIEKQEDDDLNSQLAIFTFEDDKLRDILRNLKIEKITPLKAFEILNDLIIEAKGK